MVKSLVIHETAHSCLNPQTDPVKHLTGGVPMLKPQHYFTALHLLEKRDKVYNNTQWALFVESPNIFHSSFTKSSFFLPSRGKKWDYNADLDFSKHKESINPSELRKIYHVPVNTMSQP